MSEPADAAGAGGRDPAGATTGPARPGDGLPSSDGHHGTVDGPARGAVAVAHDEAFDAHNPFDDGLVDLLADLDPAAPPAGQGTDADGDAPRRDRDPDGGGAPRRSRAKRLDATANPVSLLVGLAVTAAMPREARRALRRGAPVVVLVEVPTAAWVEPARGALVRLSDHPVDVVARDSRPRPSGADRGRVGTASAVASPVIAISPVREWLSPVTVAAADHVVVVPPLDARQVERAVALWTGRRPVDGVAAADLAGLDLADVAAALRRGTTAAECVARLRRASRSRVGLPGDVAATPLAELTGYGEAHAWATALVADIGRVRRGEMKAELLEGAVFHGPPGTGKTTLARSIAAAAGVRFVETTVGQWFSQSAGHLDGVIKMVDAFCDALAAAAKADGTAVGHCDECDAIPNRARLSDRGADWWLPVVTHVLVRFEALRRSGVVLLGSTNDLSRVDAALLRPGRLDRQFLIEPPDEAARIGILRNHLGEDLAGVDLTPAARLGVGATGAVLAGHVRAARRKCRASDRAMTLDDLLAEIVPAERRTSAQARSTALHEAGHAVAAHRLGFEVVQVSTVDGAGHAGWARFRSTDTTPDRATIERLVVGVLAGRAADVVLGGGPDAGSASDLAEATRLVTAVHASFGLGGTLAALVGSEDAERLLPLQPSLARTVEADLRRLAAEAERLVVENREAVRAVAGALVARRVLTGDEVGAICGAHPARARSGRHGIPRPGDPAVPVPRPPPP